MFKFWSEFYKCCLLIVNYNPGNLVFMVDLSLYHEFHSKLIPIKNQISISVLSFCLTSAVYNVRQLNPGLISIPDHQDNISQVQEQSNRFLNKAGKALKAALRFDLQCFQHSTISSQPIFAYSGKVLCKQCDTRG